MQTIRRVAMIEKIKQQTVQAVSDLLNRSSIKSGDIFVVGCSSSEIAGRQIGSFSSAEIGQAVFDVVNAACKDRNIYLAAQCCEHLNRALVIEYEAAVQHQFEIVNAVPQLKAGGAFAAAAYAGFDKPVLVESVLAVFGMDIGGTLIGMHLKRVAVPAKITVKQIGQANLICAKTRPKFVGGERAKYDENLY